MLVEELSEIREGGFALDREERLERLRCVAVPILYSDGTAAGSISVSGLVSRLNGEHFTTELPKMIVNVAELIQIKLRYS